MTDDAKYIVTKDGCMVIFENFLEHSRFIGLRPISAGFIWFDGGRCGCYGRSESLKLESRPEIDTEIAVRKIMRFES